MRALVLLGVAITILGACNPRPSGHVQAVATPSSSPTRGVPPLHFVGKGTPGRPIHIYQTRGNRTLYEIFAHSLQGTQAAGSSKTVLHDARVIFHDGHGGRLTSAAPTAILDEQSNEVQLEGHVHTTSSTGLILDCDTLTVNRGTDRLHGEGHVVMTSPKGMHATGERIDSNLSFTNVRLQ